MIVVKQPGQPPATVAVDGRRRGALILKELLGGEPGRAFTTRGVESGSLVAWCDDDGARKDLPLNFARPTDGAEIRGVVAITVVRVRRGELDDMCTLDKSEVAEALDLLGALGVERG